MPYLNAIIVFKDSFFLSFCSVLKKKKCTFRHIIKTQPFFIRHLSPY